MDGVDKMSEEKANTVPLDKGKEKTGQPNIPLESLHLDLDLVQAVHDLCETSNHDTDCEVRLILIHIQLIQMTRILGSFEERLLNSKDGWLKAILDRLDRIETWQAGGDPNN